MIPHSTQFNSISDMIAKFPVYMTWSMVLCTKIGNTSREADFKKKDFEFGFGHVVFEVPTGELSWKC